MNSFDLFFYVVSLLLWIPIMSYYLAMIRFSQKATQRRETETYPSISMMIPTYNEDKVIERKLQNVSALDYPKAKLEILVVDSASNDKTVEIVTNFVERKGKDLNIRLVSQQERHGKADAINYALGMCSNEIVVFTDADVLLNNDALRQIVSGFSDERTGAVSGIEVIQNPNRTTNTKIEQGYRSFYNSLRLGESNVDSVLMCESEFSAYRQELIKEGIPSNSVCDDMELTFLVRKKGFKAVYDPKAKFYEYSPIRFISRSEHKMRRGQGIQQTLLRYFSTFFGTGYGRFSLWIFPFEFFLHLIAPILTLTWVAGLALALVLGSWLSILLFVTTLTIITGALILVAGRFSPGNMITLEQSSKRSSLRLVSFPVDFLTLQIVLFAALISLAIHGPKYKWEKIEEIRSAKAEG